MSGLLAGADGTLQCPGAHQVDLVCPLLYLESVWTFLLGISLIGFGVIRISFSHTQGLNLRNAVQQMLTFQWVKRSSNVTMKLSCVCCDVS